MNIMLTPLSLLIGFIAITLVSASLQQRMEQHIVMNHDKKQTTSILDLSFVQQDEILPDSDALYPDFNNNDAHISYKPNETATYSYEQHDSTRCSGLSKLVTVNIINDDHHNGPEETSWEIKNFETQEIVLTSGKDELHFKSECLAQGPYLFVTHSSANNGEQGKYEVTIEDQRKLVGSHNKRSSKRFFLVKA